VKLERKKPDRNVRQREQKRRTVFTPNPRRQPLDAKNKKAPGERPEKTHLEPIPGATAATALGGTSPAAAAVPGTWGVQDCRETRIRRVSRLIRGLR
jgi:hypothetical protein